MGGKIIKIIASALIIALLLSNITILSAKTINHSETKSLKLSVEHKKNMPLIKVFENPYKLEIKNPSPEEVRRKIAEKYEKEYGLKIRQPVFPTPANWTFAVYLDSDNNLEDYGIYDFQEMAEVGSNETIGLRIVVLIDRCAANRGLTDRTYAYQDAYLFYVDKGEDPAAANGDEYWGEVNMGDPATLIRFLEDVLYNYSAYHYCLVLWDHGGAIYGACWDDDNGGDNLVYSEIRQALEYIYENYGVAIDVLGFDACLMGCVSMAMQFWPYVKVMVGSEEVEGADGWPYNDILWNITGLLNGSFTGTPVCPDPELLGDIIAQEYVTSYNGGSQGTDTDATHSAVNVTDVMFKVGPALSDFANILLRKYSILSTDIDTARSNSESFYYSFMIDIKNFTLELMDLVTDPDVLSAAQNLVNALDDAIIGGYHLSGHPGAYGLSIYFPTSTDGWEAFYDSFFMSMRDMWNEFARKYETSPFAANFYDMGIVYAIDDDGNGYYEFLNISWDLDEDSGTGVNLYVSFLALDMTNIELRKVDIYENTTSEFTIGSSDIYLVTGRNADEQWLTFYNFVPSRGKYAIRANVYDSTNTLQYVLHYYTFGINDDLWDIPLEPDTLAPRITIISPENQSIFNVSTFNVSISIDEAYLDQAILYINGTIVNNYTVEGSYTETITVSQDGVYNITLWARDNAGNVNITTIFVTIDTTPPLILITSPSDGDYINTSSVTIYWSASDALTGIDHYVIIVDGVVYDNNVSASTTSYTLTLSEGQHNISVVAYDVAGNSNSSSIVITIDLTLPTLNIVSPDNGSLLYGVDIEVSWQASDNYGIDHYEIRLDNGVWINVGNSTTYTLTRVSPGDHEISVKVIDLAGNTVIKKIIITNRMITSPSIVSFLNKSVVGVSTFVVSWANASNVSYFEIIVDNLTIANVSSSLNYIISNLSEGEHNITIIIHFTDGASLSDTILVLVDLSAPLLQTTRMVVIANTSTTTVNISWFGSDTVSAIDHYEVYIDGVWTNVGNVTSFTIDTSSLPDGAYVVYIRAFDVAGHITQKVVILIIDRTAPNLTIIYPSNGSVIASGTVVICWNASDSLLDIEHFEISIDGLIWLDVGRETSYVWDNLTDGVYTFYVRAYDIGGNFVEANVTFIIDTTAPDIAITLPIDGSTVTTSNVTVQWSSNATDIAYYLVRLDNGVWINVGTDTNYTFVGVPNGIHVVYVMVVDHVGNSAMDYVVFVVDAPRSRISVSIDSTQVIKVVFALDGYDSLPQNAISTLEGGVVDDDLISPRENIDVTVISTVKTIKNDILDVDRSDKRSIGVVLILSFPHYRELIVALVGVSVVHIDFHRVIFAFIKGFLIARPLFLMYSVYLIKPPQ